LIRLAAFDTATWTGSAALVEADSATWAVESVRELVVEVAGSHAVHILGLLDRLLADAGWAKSSLDAFAATRGPGSFTGLRVGLGTVRGLGLAAGRPAFGVGTLDAMAASVHSATTDRVPLLDAGRGEVFGARFDASSDPPRELVPPWVGPVGRALEPGRPDGTLIGPGAAALADGLRAAGFRGSVGSPEGSVALFAGRLALARLAAGARDGEGLVPLYVRPADAEAGPAASLRR
jgi:tRNA threonylcarbamoyladenosine biosynthesis protein TsaB